jgi:hypothetical protein
MAGVHSTSNFGPECTEVNSSLREIFPHAPQIRCMDEGLIMTPNTYCSATGTARHREPGRIAFGERLTCSVNDAAEASGLSRSMIYNKMKSGEIEWTKIGSRRLIKVPSLLRLLGLALPMPARTAAAPTSDLAGEGPAWVEPASATKLLTPGSDV